MRYAPEHKAETRRRIVDRAAELFRRHGYDGVGIDRIMAAAELTRGGFYAHFRSKAALFREVLAQEGDLARRLRAAPDAAPVIDGYLDPDNRRRIARGCTLATLTQEVPRREPAARARFAALIDDLLDAFEDHASGEEGRERAIEALLLCSGGIGLARAVGDDALAREILAVARARACAALTAPGAAVVTSPPT